MSQETALFEEIRDLLALMAEPLLLKSERKKRAALRKLVGSGKQKQRAVALMDGTRTQTAIAKLASIDQGNLSRFVKALGANKLITGSERHPCLTIAIHPTIFKEDNKVD